MEVVDYSEKAIAVIGPKLNENFENLSKLSCRPNTNLTVDGIKMPGAICRKSIMARVIDYVDEANRTYGTSQDTVRNERMELNEKKSSKINFPPKTTVRYVGAGKKVGEPEKGVRYIKYVGKREEGNLEDRPDVTYRKYTEKTKEPGTYTQPGDYTEESFMGYT